VSASGWIGFDLDGTLAEYSGWKGVEHIGDPVPAMAERLRSLVDRGIEVRIFTARVSGRDHAEAERHIQDWTERHFGQRLKVTNVKDFAMWALYDDRAIAVQLNTGHVLGGEEP